MPTVWADKEPDLLKRAASLAMALPIVALLLTVPVLNASAARGATHQQISNLGDREQSAFSSMSAPHRQTTPLPFLTLPFTDPRIVVHQGWIYSWGSEHMGVDYATGAHNSGKGESFDVVASADGYACGNCVSRQGNAVWIRHSVEGQTFFTYYGHLASIEQNIPLNNQKNTVLVKRGQKIGVAGSTGSNTLHLHFQVTGPTGIVDPYDLWTTREPYSPGCVQCRMGANYLWTTNPPSFPTGEQPPVTTESTDSADGEDGNTEGTESTDESSEKTDDAEKTCDLTYELAVEGNITEAASEVEYCLAASAGDAVSFRMFAVNGSSLDTYLKLYTPDGKLVAIDDDGAQIDGNSFLVAQLPESGTYKLVATHFNGTTGQYRLRADTGSKSALGDLNSDCVVNNLDTDFMSTAMLAGDMKADLNLDYVLDAQDQTIQRYLLGRGCMKIGK